MKTFLTSEVKQAKISIIKEGMMKVFQQIAYLIIVIGIIFQFQVLYAENETQYTLIDYMNNLFDRYYTKIDSTYGNLIEGKLDQYQVNEPAVRDKIMKYYFWHKLLTCSTCRDGNKDGIWEIPYFWHWRNPNKRLNIYMMPDSLSLNEIKPSEEFSRYKSFAYIDRTPLLYFSDLFTDSHEYYHELCGRFRTFGWCSEREMAFNSLLHLDSTKSKIYVSGNHSWSEAYIQINDELVLLLVIDNTFDNFYMYRKGDNIDYEAWKKDTGNSNQVNWYNNKAHDDDIIKALKNLRVSKKAELELEELIKKYFSIF